MKVYWVSIWIGPTCVKRAANSYRMLFAGVAIMEGTERIYFCIHATGTENALTQVRAISWASGFGVRIEDREEYCHA